MAKKTGLGKGLDALFSTPIIEEEQMQENDVLKNLKITGSGCVIVFTRASFSLKIPKKFFISRKLLYLCICKWRQNAPQNGLQGR